jgi:hypothetical protein
LCRPFTFFDVADDNVGAIWIFKRAAGVWSQFGSKLTGAGANAGDQVGRSISLSSNALFLAAGAPNANAFYVFEQTGGAFVPQAGPISPPDTIGDARVGSSISISGTGNSLAVGGPLDNGFYGATWIYYQTGDGIWTYMTKLTDGFVGTSQGTSVCLSKDGYTLAVGAALSEVHVTIWGKSIANVWTTYPEHLFPIGAVGDSQFGISCAFSSDATRLAIGANADDSDQGAVYVY